MKTTLGSISSGLVILSLTACGGGNNKEPASTEIGPNDSALSTKITANNAMLVAANVSSVNASLFDTGMLVGSHVPRSLSAASPSTGLLSVVRSQVLVAVQGFEGSVVAQSRAAVLGGVNTVCEGGGTLSINFSDQNSNSTFDVGETLALVAVNCVPATADVTMLNGTMNITSTSITGDPTLENSNYSVGATVTMSTFSIRDGAGTVSHNGQMVFLLTHTPTTETTTVDIPSFTVNDNGIPNVLTHFKLTATDNLATNQYTTTLSGVVGKSFDSLFGTFRVSTPIALQGVGDGDPTAGALKIEGDGSSSVTVVPQSDGQLRLDVDSNGDGVTDAAINTTWAALDAA